MDRHDQKEDYNGSRELYRLMCRSYRISYMNNDYIQVMINPVGVADPLMVVREDLVPGKKRRNSKHDDRYPNSPAKSRSSIMSPE